MKNPFSLGLLTVMGILLSLGGLMGFFGNWWGIVPFTIGTLMTLGFKTLNDSPREVGVISFFGKKTTHKVEGLTLLFHPFGFKIVSIVVLEMRKVDMTFKIDRITCSDGGVVTGEASLSISPGKSGQDLKDFDDAGQIEGIRKQLDDILEISVQAIAERPTSTSAYMTTKGREIGQELLTEIEGSNGNDTDIDDSRKLGIKIHKLQIKLFKDQKVIDAEQRSLVTVSMNERIQKRVDYYKTLGTIISPQDARKELIEEDMNSDGRLQEIRGGRLVNFSSSGGRKTT